MRGTLSGTIIERSRNTPVRHIFRDHAFERDEAGVWQPRLGSAHPARAVA
jgi:hypothetical protein